MHYFSVGAIFKNEAMVMNEWLEHYTKHGADHFYLINDNSTDDFMTVLKPWIKLGKITLFKNDIPKVPNRQSMAYTKFFLPILSETAWLGILDLDEYLYSPKHVHIPNVLKALDKFAVVQVNWLCFGSNGHVTQPQSIVQSFTQRAPMNHVIIAPTPKGMGECGTYGPKVILNSKFHIHGIGVHGSSADGKTINASWWANPKNPILIINHYCVMSQEYWKKVKMRRGDADCYHTDTARDMNYFKCWDVNQETDTRLAQQNAGPV